MSKITVNIVHSALREHLNSSNFQRHSSCLFISSVPPWSNAPLKSKAKRTTLHRDPVSRDIARCESNLTDDISAFVERAKFTVSGELGLRSVQSSVSGAYPTVNDLENAIGIAKRSGARTILGVGSGAAIDLAKSVRTVLVAPNEGTLGPNGGRNDPGIELILAPATLGGVMASTSETSLLLSPEEEALLPFWIDCNAPLNGNLSRDVWTVTLDAESIAVPPITYSPMSFRDMGQRHSRAYANGADAALASIAFCVDFAFALDRGYHESGRNQGDLLILMDRTIQHSLDALEGFRSLTTKGNGVYSVDKHHVIAAAVHAGQLIRFGTQTGHKDRMSLPLSFACALLPSYFPQGNLLTFAASLFPGLCKSIETKSEKGEYPAVKQIAKSLTGLDDPPMNALTDWSEEITTSTCVPPLASFAEGASDLKATLEKYDAIQSLMPCISQDRDIVESTLRFSLDRR